MRFATAILLFAMYFFVCPDCHAEDPCTAGFASPKQGENSQTAAELAHQAPLSTPSGERHHLAFGDVEFILKCGTQQDAAELFADIRDTSVRMVGATVVEAGEDFVRIAWDDGFRPHLAAFRFNFDRPIESLLRPGEKIVISGTYSSYSREPFQINMTNASFAPMPLRTIHRPKDR